MLYYDLQWCIPPCLMPKQILGYMADEHLGSYPYWLPSAKTKFTKDLWHPLLSKISGVIKGTRIYVVPLNAANGDDITAVGRNCTSFIESIIALEEPFYSNLEEFDGDILTLRTDFCYKLKVSISDLKEVIISSTI